MARRYEFFVRVSENDFTRVSEANDCDILFFLYILLCDIFFIIWRTDVVDITDFHFIVFE